jgi:hypothetical protein
MNLIATTDLRPVGNWQSSCSAKVLHGRCQSMVGAGGEQGSSSGNATGRSSAMSSTAEIAQATVQFNNGSEYCLARRDRVVANLLNIVVTSAPLRCNHSWQPHGRQ